VVRLTPEYRAEFDFGRPSDGERAEKVDFTGLIPLGPCPKCGGWVFEQPMAYVCENSVNDPRTCDFRSGRVILQRPIEREEIQKLLATGRTDLLHRFISRKGRPFSAFLVRGPDGKVGFEFAPRAGKPGQPPKKEAAPATAKKSAENKPKARRSTGRARPRARKAA